MILYDSPLGVRQPERGRTVRLRVSVADPAGVAVGFYWLDVEVSVIRQVAEDWGYADFCDAARLLKLLLEDEYDGDIATLLQDIEAGPTISRVEILEGHDE